MTGIDVGAWLTPWIDNNGIWDQRAANLNRNKIRKEEREMTVWMWSLTTVEGVTRLFISTDHWNDYLTNLYPGQRKRII